MDSFLDPQTVSKIRQYGSLENTEIEVRFKLTQKTHFHILRLLEREQVEHEKTNFIDWLESFGDIEDSTTIRKRLFDDGRELWTKKKRKFFKRNFDYGFNVVISEEISIDPVFPLEPSLVRISERNTFHLLSMRCDLTQVIQRQKLPATEQVFFELEVEFNKDSKAEDLNKVIYICLKLSQQSFVNPLRVDFDEERIVFTKAEEEKVFSKLRSMGINYSFLAKPRDILFSDFSQDKLLNPAFEYRVTRKADGERKLLVFYEGIWLVGLSKPRELQLVTRDYDPIHEGVILDGELTESLDAKDLYIPFDAICQYEFDMSISKRDHQKRLTLCQIISNYFKTLRLKYTSFSLMTKDFVTFETAEDFFSVMRSFFAKAPYLRYKNDGILFVPAKVPYTSQDIIKWKPQHQYTIDLQFRKGLWYSGDNKLVVIPAKIQSLKVMDGNVVELRYNQGVFTETRIRLDKPSANKMRVIKHVLKLIRNPITEQTLKGENDLIFMKKFHNKIKRVLIDDAVKRLKKHFRGVELLDVGSGKGADINKWLQIDKVYAVEPNQERVFELRERLRKAKNRKVEILNERIENIDFVHQVNLVTLFNVLTLLDEQGLGKLVKLLKRSVSYQGEILFLVFDGRLVESTFIGSEKNHGAIFKEISFQGGAKIRYEGDNKVFVHIPDSLVENQTEFIFYPEKFAEMLLPEFTLIRYDYAANKEKFLSAKEHIFNKFYSFGTFKRMDDDKQDVIKLGDGRTVRRTLCLLDEELPELHPILKYLYEDYRKMKPGHYNRYNFGLKFIKQYKDLHTIAYKFDIQIQQVDEAGNINTFNPYQKDKKITVMKNALIDFV